MIAVSASTSVPEVTAIPYTNSDEAYAMLNTALERFLNVVEKLGTDDWGKPTACTAWNVRDMLAHQSASYAAGASLKELIHQLSGRPRAGQLPEDAINEIQLRDRANKSPAELISELKQTGPVAARNWAYGFRPLKWLSIPHAVAGRLSLRHLMWVTHSRDTWMHRLDVCRATGQPFEQTADHDGRIAALVMLDVANALEKTFNAPALTFELTGIAGGTWKLGRGEPAASIRMDVLDFNILASGRYSYEQARPMAEISGDVHVAEEALKHILIVY